MKEFRKSDQDVLIFVAQLTAADCPDTPPKKQIYIGTYPNPKPGNQSNLEKLHYTNIDIVWTESDGRCTTDIFNMLGRVGRTKKFRIADILKDWDKNASPILTVGFNPKTKDIIKNAHPINFTLSHSDNKITIADHPTMALDSYYPNDAGIVQKTFLKNIRSSIFILAGLGTTGTEAAGNVFSQNCVWLGKMYGNSPFCLLFAADIPKGGKFYVLTAITPRPTWYRAFQYPFTYYKRKHLFPK